MFFSSTDFAKMNKYQYNVVLRKVKGIQKLDNRCISIVLQEKRHNNNCNLEINEMVMILLWYVIHTFRTKNTINYISKHALLKSLQDSCANKKVCKIQTIPEQLITKYQLSLKTPRPKTLFLSNLRRKIHVLARLGFMHYQDYNNTTY